MASQQMMAYTCDRCGAEKNIPIDTGNANHAPKWGKITGNRFGVASDNVKLDGKPADLCDPCYTEFLAWYNAPSLESSAELPNISVNPGHTTGSPLIMPLTKLNSEGITS